MNVVILLGNGFSMGFDARFDSCRLHEAVMRSLGRDAPIIAELTALAAPEDPDSAPIGTSRRDFEMLAGPLDRLAEVLRVSENLSNVGAASMILRPLRQAAETFAGYYLQVVGTVLMEIAGLCAREGVRGEAGNEEREAARRRWQGLNSFAEALVSLNEQVPSLAVFTVNYDSLLLSSLLSTRASLYDGFPWGELDNPLDRREGQIGVYHLHGYMGWVKCADGIIQKRNMDEQREQDIFASWARGRAENGGPAVLLGDLKSRIAWRDPFFAFYGELWRELQSTRLVVAGGYSFGDRPLNRVLAKYLAGSAENRLRIWNLAADRERFLRRLRLQLGDHEGRVRDVQLELEQVSLPDAEPVHRLSRELR